MPEDAKCQTGIHSEPRTPTYRAILLAGGGTVRDVVRFFAVDDAQAIERAKMMVDGHAVELWDGLRFIDQFTPVA